MKLIVDKSHRKFYGTTTLGEKGQVVIPAEARLKAKLKKGEKLLVFGFRDDLVVLSKASSLERFASQVEERLRNIKSLLKASKTKPNNK